MMVDCLSEVLFRPRSRSKTQTLMYLAGEASYRPENRILGNDFGRRSCLYPLLLSQILKKKLILEKKIGVQNFCFAPSLSEVFFRPRSRSKTQTLMFLGGEASYRLENRILGNDFGRRSCLYPLLLGQIFKKKKTVLENKIGVQNFWLPPPRVKFFFGLGRGRKHKR